MAALDERRARSEFRDQDAHRGFRAALCARVATCEFRGFREIRRDEVRARDDLAQHGQGSPFEQRRAVAGGQHRIDDEQGRRISARDLLQPMQHGASDVIAGEHAELNHREGKIAGDGADLFQHQRRENRQYAVHLAPILHRECRYNGGAVHAESAEDLKIELEPGPSCRIGTGDGEHNAHARHGKLHQQDTHTEAGGHLSAHTTLRSLGWLLGTAWVAMLPVPVFAEKAATAPPLWYAQALAQGDGGTQITHFWSKGNRLRAETVIRGHRIVSLVNGDRYYAYDEVLGDGIAVRRSPIAIRADAGRLRPFGMEGQRIIEGGAEKVGVQEMRGRSCDLYRLTDSFGKREVCVTQDEFKLPLWSELFNRSQGKTIRTDYVMWFQPQELPDRFFEPDPRLALESLEYEEYTKRSAAGPVGSVPVLYADLLHGK